MCTMPGMRRTSIAAIAATALALAACQPHGSAVGGSTASGPDSSFCQLAKDKGAANLGLLDSDDITPEQQRQVVANYDELTASAPADIKDDFVRVDKFEHDLLDAGATMTGHLSQEASGPQLHDSLTRVAAYLGQHCGIHAAQGSRALSVVSARASVRLASSQPGRPVDGGRSAPVDPRYGLAVAGSAAPRSA